MPSSAIALAILGVLAMTAPGVAAEAQELALFPRDAKTFGYRGRTQLGYVQRSPDNGPGVWLGLVDGQYVSSSGSTLTAYCTVGGLLYRWGVARRRSAARWVISRVEPKKRQLAGFVVRVHPLRWSITTPTGKRVASARGPDGPAAGVAFLTRRGC
jgi:hypothetical protein